MDIIKHIYLSCLDIRQQVMMEEAKALNYFTVQQKMLIIGGISLEGNKSLIYKTYSMFIHLLYIFYFAFLVYDVITNFDDVDVLVNSIYHVMAMVTVLSKMLTVSLNSNKLYQTLRLLETGVFAPNEERGGVIEKIWIEECVLNSKRLIITGSILAVTTLGISIISTMVKRIYSKASQYTELPFGKFSIFNPQRSPNFELAWLYQSITFPMVAVTYLSADFLIISILSHICVQFKILRNSIEKILCSAGKDTALNNIINPEILGTVVTKQMQVHNREYFSFKVKQTVRYHTAVIELAQQFKSILSVLVLINYITVAIAVGCIMYHGSLYPASDPRFQKDATIGLAVLFQLFLITYFGNEVTSESELLLSACFGENLFDMDISLQKSFNVIMIRSQKPATFTVGKFADLSLISFVAILKASFSYYTLLRSMNQQK